MPGPKPKVMPKKKMRANGGVKKMRGGGMAVKKMRKGGGVKKGKKKA